jgi:isoquinoline 1-oxidoreductase
VSLTRRTFIELVGGATAYAFSFSCKGRDPVAGAAGPTPVSRDEVVSHARRYFVDYTEWLLIHADGSVTVHTGRVDMGQGLETVLSNIVSQGLQLPPERVRLVLGDTDRCPDDGPTEGSQATRLVGWGYWRACERIRDHLVTRAADVLGVSERKLEYRGGFIVGKNGRGPGLGIGELADGTLHLDAIDPSAPYQSRTRYTDRGTPRVNADAIVTGTLVYAGDLFPGECSYGAFLSPQFHIHTTRLESADLAAARKTPGVALVRRVGRTAGAVGSSFNAVRRGLDALVPVWATPNRGRTLDVEGEIRARAELAKTIEGAGDPEARLDECPITIGECYRTQYASQAPMETETAVAEVAGDRVTVWASTQAPFKARKRVAKRLELPEEKVRIISMPLGGGFGVKVDTPAPDEAALLARMSGKRVKHVYSRDYQFNGRARYKEAVVADITSGVTRDGRLLARTIDLHQDEGFGTTGTYDIPQVRTRLFHSKMPARHGTMRGTSFVQSCFAVESHTDVVADAVGMDPVEFRRKNLALASFGPLLDACAEMIDRDRAGPVDGRGVGFAICRHGGRQLGAVAAEVSVDAGSGAVRVERLAGAFDIGLVININTLTANTKGAMIWGLGFALFEEVRIDGHRSFTRSLSDYRIPRFEDVPPIEIAFLSNEVKNPSPRGCGELPVIPTVGAVANAVARATGVRFHSLPLTPERVLEGLRDR